MKTLALRFGTALAGVAALGLVATGTAEAAEVDGPKVDWNLSLWGKKRAFTSGLEAVVNYVSDKTGGNFTINMALGEALSKSRENLDGIKLGAFEMAAFCNFYHPGKNPSFMVMSLPFLPLANPDVHEQVAEALYQHPAAIADMDRWNAKLYLSSLLPQYEFLGRGDAPTTTDGFDGMRVRAGGGIGRAMEVLGATRTTVPAPEVYTVIERGTVDAVSFPFTYAHFAYRVHEVATWYTSNLKPGTSECPTVINKDAWAALPPQYQQVLMDAKPVGYAALKTAYAEIDKKNLPILEQKLQKIVYTDADLAKFREKAGQPVWDEWVAENKDKFDSEGLLKMVLDTAKAAM